MLHREQSRLSLPGLDCVLSDSTWESSNIAPNSLAAIAQAGHASPDQRLGNRSRRTSNRNMLFWPLSKNKDIVLRVAPDAARPSRGDDEGRPRASNPGPRVEPSDRRDGSR